MPWQALAAPGQQICSAHRPPGAAEVRSWPSTLSLESRAVRPGRGNRSFLWGKNPPKTALSAGGRQRLEDLLEDVSNPDEEMLSMQEEKGNSDHATLDGGFADLFSQRDQFVPVDITSLHGAIRILQCPAASSTQTSTLLKR